MAVEWEIVSAPRLAEKFLQLKVMLSGKLLVDQKASKTVVLMDSMSVRTMVGQWVPVKAHQSDMM